MAEKWIEGGATSAIIRSAFRHGIQKVVERQGEPPSRLKYFDGMIREAMAISRERPATRQADGMSREERVAARVKNYISMVEAAAKATGIRSGATSQTWRR